MTTIEEPLFLQVIPGIIDRIGPYPGAALRALSRRKLSHRAIHFSFFALKLSQRPRNQTY